MPTQFSWDRSADGETTMCSKHASDGGVRTCSPQCALAAYRRVAAGAAAEPLPTVNFRTEVHLMSHSKEERFSQTGQAREEQHGE